MPSFLTKLLLFLALIVPAAGTAHAQGPQQVELAEYAEAVGCQRVKNFYDRSGMVEPSYLYGYMPGWGMVPEKERDKSVVFWCKKKGKDRVYQLVVGQKKNKANSFTLKESQKLAMCPAVMEWPESVSAPPGGLSVGRKMGVPLRGFQFADLPGEPIPRGEFTDHQPLQSLYDGAGWYFYCHEGEWLMRGRH